MRTVSGSGRREKLVLQTIWAAFKQLTNKTIVLVSGSARCVAPMMVKGFAADAKSKEETRRKLINNAI